MPVMRQYAVLLALSLVTSGSALGDLSSEERTLLDAVRTVREATLSKITQGRGVAEASFQGTSLTNKGERLASARPKHRVEFLFAGSDSLRKDYAPAGQNVINESFLFKGDREARYFSGAEHIPSSVSINRRGGFIWLDPVVTNWCYEDFARLPFPAEESQFWQAVGGTTFVTSVSREGTVVRLTFGLPPSDYIQSDEHIIEFDLAKGGMISRWSDRRVEKRGNVLGDITVDGKMSWREIKEGLFLPVQRRCEFVGKRNGEETQRSLSEMDFSEFSIETVRPEELEIDKMGIPIGTPVVDSILGTEYRYGTSGEYGDDPSRTAAAAVDALVKPDNASSRPVSQERPTRHSDTVHGQTPNDRSREPASGGSGIAPAYMWLAGGILLVLLVVIIVLAARMRRREHSA